MKFVLFIILVAILLGVFLVGGFEYPNTKLQRSRTNIVVTPNPVAENDPQKTLQLGDFSGTRKCISGEKVAVHLLLDNSTSMLIEGGKKLRNLKAAVIELGRNLADTDVLGVQLFDPSNPPVFPIDYFSRHRSTFDATIDGIKSRGGTPTEDRLRDAKAVMDAGFPQFPDYKPTLIMFTDGCPNPGQQPIPIAQEIRNSGVKVIVVGIELGNAGKCDKIGGAEGAKQLMQQIAPGNYYDAADSDQLKGLVPLLKESLSSC